MRILVVYNSSTAPCGFRHLGDQLVTALRRGCATDQVDVWDGTYPVLKARLDRGEPAYWPGDIATYDVVHLIWHPGTLGHYTGADWPVGPLYSLFQGELPPWSTCPIADRFAVRFGREPARGIIPLGYPLLDWVEDFPPPAATFTVGISTIRGEGVDAVRACCSDRGWEVNAPSPVWLSPEDEVRRLARSSINVCWYASVIGGLAGAPSTCLASRRPLLINTNEMLCHMQGEPGVYCWPQLTLPHALDRVHRDWQAGTLRDPTVTLPYLGWTAAARKLRTLWEDYRT